MSSEKQDDQVPKFMVICRAVAEWPDTTVAEVKIGSYEEPSAEDIERCKENIADLYQQMVVGEDGEHEAPARVAVVVLPYCANDEPEAPEYDPSLDGDLYDQDDLQDLQ